MERHVVPGGRQGSERLLRLARERWRDMSALLSRAGAAPGMRGADPADPTTLISGPRIFQLRSSRAPAS